MADDEYEEIIDETEYEEVLEDGDYLEEEIIEEDDGEYLEESFTEEEYIEEDPTPANMAPTAPGEAPAVGAPAPMAAIGAPVPVPAPMPRASVTLSESYDDPNSVDKLQSWLGDFERGQASTIRPESPKKPFPFEVQEVRPAPPEQLVQPSLAAPAPAPAPTPALLPLPQQSHITPQQSQTDMVVSPAATPLLSNVSRDTGQPVEQQIVEASQSQAQPQSEPSQAVTTSTESQIQTQQQQQPQTQAPAPSSVEGNELVAVAPSRDVEAVIPVKEADKASSKDDKTDDGSEEKRSGVIYFLLILLVLILIVLAILAILIWGTETIDPFDDNGPDFVGDLPTTPMDTYMPDTSCEDLEGQAQPHVITQCRCNDEITSLTDDARAKYNSLVSDFLVPTVYPSWDFSIESCETANQAVVWLSTVNARDDMDLLQKYIMAYLYFGTNGPDWDIDTSWISDEEVCEWYGLNCGEDGSLALQTIELESNSLMGMIPTELSLLTGLETLSFFENSLSGSIPTLLFALPELKMAIFTTNRLYGSLPTEVGTTPNLEVLRVGGNQLDGSIISELGQATLLRELDLGENTFEGELPSELYQLTGLVFLSIESNIELVGRIPTELSLFTDLRYLSISDTSFRSRFPSEFTSLTNLEDLRIANTLVGGEIPRAITELTSLRRLDLGGSRFRQSLPDYIDELTNLEYLALNDNGYDGPINPYLGNMTKLKTLLLHGNEFSGSVPSQLGLLTALETLTLEDNFLTGRAPEEICNLRELALDAFSTDCPSRTRGVVCPIDTCCTSCRFIPSLDEDE